MICPICKLEKTDIVRYHISYNPKRVILACAGCNFVEYLYRTGRLAKVLLRIEFLRLKLF